MSEAPGKTVKTMNRRGNLLEDPIPKTLFQLAWPMMIGMLAMTMFNLADTWYVAQIGVKELAAMTFTFPVVMILNGLTLGIGTGATAIISQRYGAGDREEVRKLARDGLLLALTLVVIVTSAGLLTIKPLFRALGADETLLPMVSKYIHIWYLGTMFVVVPMVGNSAIRGTGDTRTPAFIMTAAAVGNIILDPLFIFGPGPFPRWELQGAAFATVLSRAVTMLMALYVLVIRDKMVLFTLPKPKELWSHWKRILVVGGPASLMMVLTPITFGVLTRMVSEFGTGPVAAFGAGMRVDMFAMMVPMATASGLMVFVGQNWGAGRRDRVRKALGLSQRFLVFTGAIIFLLIAALAHPIAAVFSTKDAVLIPMRFFLRVAEIGLLGDSLSVITVQTYNALRRPSRVLMVSVIRLLVLLVPLAWLGGHFWGIDGLFAGMGVARLLSGFVARIFLLPVMQENGDR